MKFLSHFSEPNDQVHKYVWEVGSNPDSQSEKGEKKLPSSEKTHVDIEATAERAKKIQDAGDEQAQVDEEQANEILSEALREEAKKTEDAPENEKIKEGNSSWLQSLSPSNMWSKAKNVAKSAWNITKDTGRWTMDFIDPNHSIRGLFNEIKNKVWRLFYEDNRETVEQIKDQDFLKKELLEKENVTGNDIKEAFSKVSTAVVINFFKVFGRTPGFKEKILSHILIPTENNSFQIRTFGLQVFEGTNSLTTPGMMQDMLFMIGQKMGKTVGIRSEGTNYCVKNSSDDILVKYRSLKGISAFRIHDHMTITFLGEEDISDFSEEEKDAYYHDDYFANEEFLKEKVDTLKQMNEMNLLQAAFIGDPENGKPPLMKSDPQKFMEIVKEVHPFFFRSFFVLHRNNHEVTGRIRNAFLKPTNEKEFQVQSYGNKEIENAVSEMIFFGGKTRAIEVDGKQYLFQKARKEEKYNIGNYRVVNSAGELGDALSFRPGMKVRFIQDVSEDHLSKDECDRCKKALKENPELMQSFEEIETIMQEEEKEILQDENIRTYVLENKKHFEPETIKLAEKYQEIYEEEQRIEAEYRNQATPESNEDLDVHVEQVKSSLALSLPNSNLKQFLPNGEIEMGTENGKSFVVNPERGMMRLPEKYGHSDMEMTISPNNEFAIGIWATFMSENPFFLDTKYESAGAKNITNMSESDAPLRKRFSDVSQHMFGNLFPKNDLDLNLYENFANALLWSPNTKTFWSFLAQLKKPDGTPIMTGQELTVEDIQNNRTLIWEAIEAVGRNPHALSKYQAARDTAPEETVV